MRGRGERIMPRSDPLSHADVKAIAGQIRGLNKRANALIRRVVAERRASSDGKQRR
jgi:hypothetical protein